MSEPAAAPRPDTTDMFAVHGVFRDTLGAAPTLVGGIAPDDTERVALIANYYENILSFLEAHHDGEELLVFPLLRERDAAAAELMDEMDRAAPRGDRSAGGGQGGAGRVARGRRRGTEGGRGAAGRTGRHLCDHLDEEEAKVLPLAAEYLSMEEWGALPGHGMANFHGDKIWLILGLIRERMTDEQRAGMTEHMPPPALEMWNGFGEQAFKEYSTVVEVDGGQPRLSRLAVASGWS